MFILLIRNWVAVNKLLLIVILIDRYYQNLINETLSTPLSTLEAENYVPAKHAEAEPEIRVCL